MTGYGNRSVGEGPDLTSDHDSTRYGISHSSAYSGGSDKFSSGTVGGAGSGNKADASSDGPDLSEMHSNTRYDIGSQGAPYVDGDSRFKSGTVGGPGYGNKTAQPKTDSTSGKLMEKIGGMMGREDVVEKGREKRAHTVH